MKWRLYLISFSLILFIFASITVNVLGNPIVFDPIENPILKSFFMVILFLLGTSLEFLLLRRIEFLAGREPISLFQSFFKVNLVTFPLTQILAYIVYIYLILFFWLYVLIIEIFVVLIEWILLKTELNKSYNIRIKSIKFLAQVGLVNCGSFLLGLLLFIPSYV